jgi:hypothetical protein
MTARRRGELYERARAQVAAYDAVALRDVEVVDARAEGDGRRSRVRTVLATIPTVRGGCSNWYRRCVMVLRDVMRWSRSA